MREMRVLLDEEDFRALVAGGTVRKEGSGGPIAIRLQDFGIARMAAALWRALDVSAIKAEPGE